MIATQDSFNWKMIGPELKVKRFFFIKSIGLFRKKSKGKENKYGWGSSWHASDWQRKAVDFVVRLSHWDFSSRWALACRFKANPLTIMSPGLGLQNLKLEIWFSLHLRTVIREVAETLIKGFLMLQPTRERENTTKDFY